jgi:hypothetical protein
MRNMPKRNIEDSFCLHDENTISLKTVFFQDTGYIAWMLFLPKPEDFGKREPGICFLYRRNISEENVGLIEDLLGDHFAIWTQLLDLDVPFPPNVQFLWSDNGQNVAVVVEGRLIGFLAEGRQSGYSKLLRKGVSLGNAWNEDLFKQLFEIRGQG